jgi:hypothetical protein
VPLTDFQRTVLRLLAGNRSPESYLAGGAALQIAPNSRRFSRDLDFFHDSERRVAEAFQADRDRLESSGFSVDIEFSLPGNVRALVSREGEHTRIDWAHDSAWRFMPVIRDEASGYRLHDIDLAINKLLALAGRDEPRDYVDALDAHQRILSLGALVWAAAGKDPGLSPHAIHELLKRRGRPRQEELDRLHLARPWDAGEAKALWLRALDEARAFIDERPAEELGCLYYSAGKNGFVTPDPGIPLADQGLAIHFGAPGGVIPIARDPSP